MKTAANWQPFFFVPMSYPTPKEILSDPVKPRGLCKILIFLDENLKKGYELT
jgi:hypothetical protein